ncbi:MAG: FG-GAP-like repeat-containing protein [Rhodothermales bacterium]
MRHVFALTVLIATLLPISAIGQMSPAPHFVPRYTFEGSELQEWQAVGGAEWAAENGIIHGNAGSDGGMLLFDRSYEDAAFFTRFRCDGACDAGVLLRIEETASGMKGLLVRLHDGTSRVFRVTLDSDGTILTSEPAGEPAGDDAPSIVPGEWNDLSVTVEGNNIHHDLGHGWHEFPVGSAQDLETTGSFNAPAHYDPEVIFGFGPIGLYVGSGSVEFDDVSTRNLLRQDFEPEWSSHHFRVQQLNEFYHAWGVDAGDINNDGMLDLVSGPFYYLAPDYRTRHEIYRSRTYHPGEEYVPDMVTFSGDFTGDGWDDVLATESRALVLYVNPQGERRHWTRYDALPEICSEIVIKYDVDNDGEPEFVYSGGDGRLAYGEPDPNDPTAVWPVHHISEPFGDGCTAHGLGVGDVNGDGRADVLNQYGWWEQPAAGPDQGTWTHHEGNFGRGGAITVYDFNGDGLNDVVASNYAHSRGLYWYEQIRGEDGGISFVKRTIFENLATRNAGGVAFSQVHSGALVADMDGDGVKDFVTGKRHWSHLNQYLDADHDGEAVVYWYRTVRDVDAPGGVRFEPDLIHNKSGVGSEFEVVDMNGDGAPDVISSGTRGTFIFWNRMGGGLHPASQ